MELHSCIFLHYDWHCEHLNEILSIYWVHNSHFYNPWHNSNEIELFWQRVLLLAFLEPIMIKKLFKATENNYLINSEKFENFDLNYKATKYIKRQWILKNTAYCYHCQTRKKNLTYHAESDDSKLSILPNRISQNWQWKGIFLLLLKILKYCTSVLMISAKSWITLAASLGLSSIFSFFSISILPDFLLLTIFQTLFWFLFQSSDIFLVLAPLTFKSLI